MALALPPLAKLSEVGAEQVKGASTEHVKFTPPLKPFADTRLITTLPPLPPPAVTGTIVVSGTSVKSESGLDTELGLVIWTADGR
jgi:hypothetical protein